MRFGGYELAANVSLLFGELPFAERFAAARAAGFETVECWWPFPTADPDQSTVDELLSTVDKAGVQLVGMNFFAGDMPSGERGVLSDPDRRDEYRASLAVVKQVAERTGCRVFNALYGARRPGLAEQTQRETARRNLAEADLPGGARVVVEALTIGENGDYPLTTCADLDELAAATGAGILFDTYHLTNNGEDLLAAIDRYADRIAHVQVADSPGRHEPGTGGIDFAAVLQALHQHGYPGLIAAEYRPTGPTIDGLRWTRSS